MPRTSLVFLLFRYVRTVVFPPSRTTPLVLSPTAPISAPTLSTEIHPSPKQFTRNTPCWEETNTDKLQQNFHAVGYARPLLFRCSSHRNLYNEWVLCAKKADEAGDSAKKCHPKRHNALAICPDEWVSFNYNAPKKTTVCISYFSMRSCQAAPRIA